MPGPSQSAASPRALAPSPHRLHRGCIPLAAEEHWKENGKTHLIISKKKEEKTARRKVQTSRFSSPPASLRGTLVAWGPSLVTAEHRGPGRVPESLLGSHLHPAPRPLSPPGGWFASVVGRAGETRRPA